MPVERRIYDASLPLFASWSTESPIFTAVVFLQVYGNEIRAIGAKSWKNQALHSCIEDALRIEFERKWRIRTHVTPFDRDHVIEEQFTDAGLRSEAAPKVADLVILTRRLMATLVIDQDADGNEELIEAINQYAPREKPGGFTLDAGHTLEQFTCRALEIFAAWKHAGGIEDDWGPAPDYSRSDRARI